MRTPPKSPGSRGRRLTPEEKEGIIELRLQRVPVRKVAETIGCTPTTVGKVYKQYITERSKERHAELEDALEGTLLRLERNADDARRGFQDAVLSGSDEATRWLELERKTLTDIARLHTTLIGNRTVVGAAAVADSFAETLQTFLQRAPQPPDVRVEYRDV